MNVLFLTHRAPHPPNRGDRIRSYHILRFLSARASVDLACLSTEPVVHDSRRELARLCRRVAIIPHGRMSRWVRAATAFAGGRSATEGLFKSPALVHQLHQWALDTQYDAVLAYCSSMGQYLQVGRLQGVRSAVDFVDVDSQKWFDYAEHSRPPLCWLHRAEGRRVRRLERELAAQAHAITLVSDAEASLLRQHSPQGTICTVPIGVDFDAYAGGVAGTAGARENDSRSDRFTCAFVGALDYRPNVDGLTWFCREVWPGVGRRLPQLKLVLVGRNPSTAVRRLAQHPHVELVGEVPDVCPYLQSADVVVVPLRIARGVQTKILEALAVGKPVVASPAALEGLHLTPREHAYSAETPEEWLNAIAKLQSSAEERRRLAAAGQNFVRLHHNWENCLEPLSKLLGLGEPTADLEPATASADLAYATI